MSTPAQKVHVLRQGSGGFPDWEETEYEQSTVRMPVRQNGKLIEEVALRAFLKIQRYTPFELLGHRQFEFLIEEWEVIGKSKAFGNWIGYTLSNVPQPKSLCRAVNEGSDYPALIVYNAIYDVYVGKDRVFENVAGLGVGREVMDIPPRNIPVGFGKPFEAGGIAVEAGMCVEMSSLTKDDYGAQVEELKALREGRLSEPSVLNLPV